MINLGDHVERPDPNVFGHLAIVNAFDIYSHYVATDYDEIRTDAIKDFLIANGVEKVL